MSSNKRSSSKTHSHPSAANRQHQNVHSQSSTKRANYAAPSREDENFFKGISKQIIKIKNERDEKIKKIIESVDGFMKDRPQYSEDHELASKGYQLLHQLHETLRRPLLYQDEVQIHKLSPEDHSRDDRTKTMVVSEDTLMLSECTHPRTGPSAIKDAYQQPPLRNSLELKNHSRVDQRFDSTTTPSGRESDSVMSEKTHPSTGNIFMEVTEEPPTHPLTYQDVIGKKMDRRPMHVKAACSDSIKTSAGKEKETKTPGRTTYKTRHQAMEVSDTNALEANGPRKVCLLLLGSSGNGKSSMGNSILGREEFKTSSSVNSSAPRIAMGSAQVGDQTVCVVDGPSILDSREAGEEFMERIVASMETSLTLCDYAFSAIVIVLRFGVRFTKQEVETIKLIKAVLGKNIIQDYGICAITYGDNFEHAVEEAREDGHVLTFEGWCHEQTGEVRALFEECSFRCVLFDNRTKDEDEKKTQRKLLLKMVDPTRTYSKEEFLKAEESLKEVLDKEALIHELEQQTQQLIDNTRNGMGEISEDDSYQDSNSLDSLLQQLKLHQEYIADIGLSSPKLNQLLMSLRLLQNEIHSKIRQRRLMEDNMRPTAPSSRNVFSLPSSQPTRPLPTYDLPVDDLFSVGHASSSGIKSRNMNYTSSDSDWFFEQSESNRLPTYHGHLAASSDLGRNRSLDNIWKYFRIFLGKINIGKIYKL